MVKTGNDLHDVGYGGLRGPDLRERALWGPDKECSKANYDSLPPADPHSSVLTRHREVTSSSDREVVKTRERPFTMSGPVD